MAFIVRNKFPIDTQLQKAVGVNLPFSGRAVFTSNYLTRDAIRNNLINFFSTRKGERVMNPLFGSIIQQTVFEIGSIENSIYNAEQHIAKLKEQKQVLFSDLATLETKEVELATTLREKYGDGTINPQTGEVTPT
jgi:hypothetical protein